MSRPSAGTEYHLGTCGWSFADWRGSFYPEGCKDELAYYATCFGTVEIDSTWYRIPSHRTVASWAKRVSPGFLFCPKLPGEITHDRLLVDAGEPLERFWEVIQGLGGKLGPVLVQLSPHFAAADAPRLEEFLRALPGPQRYAVEFRHRSWATDDRGLAILRQAGAALVMADHPWYPRFEAVTTDFAYLRLLGRRGVFPDFAHTHRTRDSDLERWVGVLQGLGDDVGQVFVFANNQFEGHSPATVMRLAELLGVGERTGSGAPSPRLAF